MVASEKRKRAASTGSAAAGVPKQKAFPGSAQAPASSARPASSAAVVAYVTVVDADALDCGVCFLPLKPPIFQCDVGHVVCSPCRNKLKITGKCYICGVATGDYRRCHAMERLVEAIRVPCPHAAYGCTDKLAYFDQNSHRQACAHAPCHCPDEACSFIGSMAALMGHITGVHSWPSTTEVRVGDSFTVRLRDGFNLVRANHATFGGRGATASSRQYLLLLNVVRQQPLGRAISVVCIHPHGASSREMKCHLTQYVNFYNRRGNQVISHYQSSTFIVAQTDLSDRLPSLDGCFQFVVPDSVLEDANKDAIDVIARIENRNKDAIDVIARIEIH